MRTVCIILGILSLLGVLLGAVGVGIKDADLINVAELGSLGDFAAGLAGGSSEVPSESSLNTGMMLAFVIILISIFGIIALFLKGKGVVMAATGIVAISTIVLWVLQPSYDPGRLGGLDPKQAALFVMISGIVGAACIYGAYATRKKPVLA